MSIDPTTATSGTRRDDKGALTAAVFDRALVGAVAWGLAGDLVGRRLRRSSRPCCYSGLSALASSAVGERLGALCACRFFAGIGAGGRRRASRSPSSYPELPATATRRRGRGRRPGERLEVRLRLRLGACSAGSHTTEAARSLADVRGYARRVRGAVGAGPSEAASAASSVRVGGGGLAAAVVRRGLAAHTRSSRLHGASDCAGRAARESRPKRVFQDARRAHSFFFCRKRERVFSARFPALAAIWFALSFGWYGTMLLAPRGVRARRFLSRNGWSRLAARVPGEPARRPRRGARERRQRVFRRLRRTRQDAARRRARRVRERALAFAAVAAVSRDGGVAKTTEKTTGTHSCSARVSSTRSP